MAVWEDRMKRLVGSAINAEEIAERQVLAVLDETTRVQDRLRDLQRDLERRRTSLRAERDALEGMRNDPEVFVRAYGAHQDVFHSADHPCGWVPGLAIAGRADSGYTRMLHGEAIAQGKRPCSSCGYTVMSVAQG